MAGAREGVHLGTSATSVRRMRDGAQPHWPVPRLVAAVLSQRLHRQVLIADCGFADRSPALEDRYDGLRCSGTLEGAVRTVAELSGRDMRRRNFLLGSAFTAAAFSEPALFAVTAPPAEATARAGGARIGMADVEIIHENIAHLRKLDHQYGAGRVRERIVQVLHHETDKVVHGTYSEKTGKALLGAVAQLTDPAAGTAHDVGRHSLAQRYYIQALDLAMGAGDRIYAADVLVRMSFLTVVLTQGPQSGRDRLRSARQALALARAGHTVAAGAVTPQLSASLHAVEARSFALSGDGSATRRAMSEVERQFGRIRPGDEPPALGSYAEGQFAADLGRCLLGVGDPNPGVRQLTRALETNSPGRVRSRCVMEADLAAAHLDAGDHERAAAYGRDALRTAAQLDSVRTLDRLRTLQHQVRPRRATSLHLKELDDRLAAVLDRS